MNRAMNFIALYKKRLKAGNIYSQQIERIFPRAVKKIVCQEDIMNTFKLTYTCCF
jgi:hypothetical protein